MRSVVWELLTGICITFLFLLGEQQSAEIHQITSKMIADAKKMPPLLNWEVRASNDSLEIRGWVGGYKYKCV